MKRRTPGGENEARSRETTRSCSLSDRAHRPAGHGAPLSRLANHRAAAALALLASLITDGPVHAQAIDAIAVQATFVPKFPRYVAWPAARQPLRGAPYQLCVIGEDPFGPRLDAAAASERIDDHGVIVRRLPDMVGAEACHLAFVQGRQPVETDRMLFALRDRPVLTITAGSGTARGIIHLATIAGRVRFFINDAEAARHGLTISSRLLALAAGVTPRR